jgi:hypothetical protein
MIGASMNDTRRAAFALCLAACVPGWAGRLDVAAPRQRLFGAQP